MATDVVDRTSGRRRSDDRDQEALSFKEIDVQGADGSHDTGLDSAETLSRNEEAAREERAQPMQDDTLAPVAPEAKVPPADAPEEGRTKLQTTLIMIALASALFLAALDVTIVTVAIPTISEQFHSSAGYTWIGSAYLLANAASAPSWGKISDIWGRKQILLLAVAVFWVGSLLAGVSVNMAMLIASRAVQGVGGGGIVTLVNVCISDLFSMRKRGIYLGMMGMVWAVAGGVGPVLGGVFAELVTWRWCFYVNLPISGVGFAVLFFVLKLHNPRTPVRQGLKAVDWLGSLAIIGGTLMLLLGLTYGGVDYPWSSPTVICLLIFGVVTIGIFGIIEWKVATYPLIPLTLFHNPQALAALGCSFCHGYVFVSASYYLPLYFQAVLRASPLLSGAYVLPFSVILAFSSAGTGVFIKKTGKYLPPIIFGFVLMTLGYGLFVDMESRANWAKIILYQVVAGIGVGPNFQAPLIALQTTVKQRDIASATATFGFIRQLSTSISVVVGGVVFQNGMEKQFPRLLRDLGPDVANLLSGGNAAASVGLVSKLDGPAGDEAREAYWDALRTMFIMYVAFAGLGLFIACFVGQSKLSKEHEEHKTGLEGMKRAKESEKAAKTEKATGDAERAPAAGGGGVKEG